MNENDFRNSIGKPLSAIGLIALWLLVFFVPVVEITTCTQGSEDAWLGSLVIFLPMSVIALALAFISSKSQTRLKWLSLPLFVLLPWAAFIACKYVLGATIGGKHLCVVSTGELGFGAYPISWWAPLWGPLQLIFIALCAWCVIRYWWPKANC